MSNYRLEELVVKVLLIVGGIGMAWIIATGIG